jgi:hypothetical protein
MHLDSLPALFIHNNKSLERRRTDSAFWHGALSPLTAMTLVSAK